MKLMELLFGIAPLVIWYFGSLSARNTIALPRGFMYEFVSVYDNDHQIMYPGSAMEVEMKEDGGRTMDLSGGKLYAHMNQLQTAKYGSMCYGNREDMHLSMQHHEDLIRDEKGAANIWSSQTGSEPAMRELVRSVLLEKWQRETEGTAHTFFGSRSFCACIDEMHFSLVSHGVINARKKALLNTVDALVAANTSWMSAVTTSLKNHSVYEHIVLNEIDYTKDKDLRDIVINMRSANLLLDSAEMKLSNEEDVMKFCNRQALPTQTMQFDGIMDSWRYICIGQFFLLVSCLVSYEISWLGTAPHDGPHSEFTFGPKQGESVKILAYVPVQANTAFSVIRFVLYVVAFGVALYDTRTFTFVDEMRFAHSTTSQNPHGEMSIFSDVANIDGEFALMAVAVWLVLVLCEILKWRVVRWSVMNAETRPWQTLVNRVVYTVLQDVLNIFALTLISIGVQVQMGVKELTTIYVIATVVGCTAFIQHISNLIGIYFDWVAKAGNDGISVDGNILKDTNNDSLRKALLRVCYIRSGIFLFVLLASIFVIAHVGVTRAPTSVRDVKSMGGLLFGVAFFVILCGFDFVYELFNVRGGQRDQSATITAQSRRWMHVLFVFSYIIFVNFVQQTQKY